MIFGEEISIINMARIMICVFFLFRLSLFILLCGKSLLGVGQSLMILLCGKSLMGVRRSFNEMYCGELGMVFILIFGLINKCLTTSLSSQLLLNLFCILLLVLRMWLIYPGSRIVISCLKICPTTLQIKYYHSLLLLELMDMTPFGAKAQIRINFRFKLLNCNLFLCNQAR